MTDIYSPANGDILDELEQPVYIADVDTYEMLYMNKACMRLLNCRDYHGKMCYRITQGGDSPCSFCTSALLSRDKFYNWDHFNEKLGGAYQLQDKLISWQGHNARLEIVFDVSSRVERVNELQTVLETERQLVRAIQTVNGPGAIGERLNAALKLCGEYFQADRAYIFRVDEDGGLSNTYEWCKTGVEPQMHLLQHLDLHYIDRWMPYFEKQETVVTPDIEKIKDSKPDEYRTLSMQGIRSILEAPLFSSGRFIGFVGVDNPAAAKMENSGDILLSLAFAVSNALVRANSESELRSFQKRYELAEESAELGVWEYHIQAHRITNISHSLKKFGVPDTLENVPESILPLVLPADRKRLLEMFRRIEAGEPRVTEDIWMTWKPGLPLRCERTIYSVAKDADGRPSVAYGVGINITEQKLEEEKFSRAIQSLLTANPESLGTFRVNITKNICQEGHGASDAILRLPQADSVDGLIGNIAALISDPRERADFEDQLGRLSLLGAFKTGCTVRYVDYRRDVKSGGFIWVRTFVRMLKNPETEDVEGVVYSLNVTNEKRREKMFQIITDQEYDYTALLYVKTGKIEFLNLSSRLLPKYHEALGRAGQLFGYEDVRKFAVSTFIAAEDRELYLKGSALPVIVGNLDEKGRYEINVRGHYTGRPDEFMYRKIQHYYLDYNRDVVLLVQSDVTEAFQQQRKEMDRMRDILDSISAGVSVMLMPDRNHLQFQYVNIQLYRLLGFPVTGLTSVKNGSEEGLVKAYWEDAFSGIHPDDLERVKKTFRDNFYEPFFVVGRYRTLGADGYRWLEQEVKLRRALPNGREFYATYRDVTKEVKLQQKLDEQQQKQLERTLLDTIGSLPACSVLYRENKSGMLVPERYSDEFCRLKGCTQETIKQFNSGDGFAPVHPDDRRDLEKTVTASRGDSQMHMAVYRIITKDNGYRWVSVNFTHFSLGGQNYLYAVYTDIDDLKKQEQQIEEQYNSAQTFLDSVADSYIATLRANLSQNLVEAVKGADPLAPVAAQPRYDDAVGALLAQMPREQDRRECAEFFSRQALINAYEDDVRNLSKEYMYQSDEGVKWARCVITLTKRPGSGDIVSFMAVSDINEAKLLSAIMDQVVTRHFDYVCCINVNSGRVTLFFANTGWPGGVAIQPGSDYEKILNEYNIKTVIASERERSVEFMSLAGVRRALEHSGRCAASFTCDEGEGLRVKRVEFSYLDRENGLLALVRTDVTEAQKQQLEQEEKLRAALTAAQKANAAKSDFLSRMSHDIRTPLNGIIGMTYIAQEQDNPPRTRDCLGKIDTSSKFLLGLVNDVLDMSKAESGKLELHLEPYAAAPFFKYLDSVIAPLCEEKNIRFVVDAEPVSGFLPLLDPLRINQVFFNLLSNAVKFTPEGGTVTYRLREHLTDAGRMVLDGWVCDTGIGMSETFQQVLFEPFSQENRRDNSETRGTGLGLAIVKKSLDLMGCTISVKSKIGAGSVFHIKGEFDCAPAAQAAGGAAPAAADSRCESALAGRHALLCEDHPLNQEIAKALLEEKKIVVSIAEDGREAVDMFKRSAPGFYDLVLMDIRMPVMDGYDATQAIRALDRSDAATVPIIAMTADAFADDVRKCLDLGMNDHIAKPIDPEILFRKLTAVLRERK